MSKTIGNDKAIEFQSELLKTNRMIKNLETIGVDSNIYQEQVEAIVKECQKETSIKSSTSSFSSGIQVMERATAELVYTNAISNLQKLQLELNGYGIYFSAFNYVDSVNLSRDFSKEELSIIAKNVIGLLDVINNSNTKYYESEKKVVEKLYSFAYQIIKLELKFMGQSKVLNWAKNDSIAANFIDHEIEKDLENLSEEELDNPIIKNALSSSKAQGLNFSYLNEALILYVSIQNNDELLDNIRAELLKIIEELQNHERILKNNNATTARYEEKIKKTKKENRKEMVKFSLNLVADLSVICGVLFGAYKVGKEVSRTEKFMTNNGVYSQSDVIQTPRIDSYEVIIDSDAPIENNTIKKTYVIEYEPWDKSILSSEFSRDITTYDVSGIAYDELEDYLSLNLEELGIDGVTTEEQKESLNPDDLYDSAIIEVEQIIQNLENEEITYDDIFFTVLLSEIVGILLLIFVHLVLETVAYYDFLEDCLLEIPYKFKENFQSKKECQKMLEKIKKLLEESKQLSRENNEFRDRFISLYQKYAPFLQDDELEQNYQRLVRKKSEG